mmetsp:Transcript_11360/g.21854  ORF Transcript_11360/g.21854 Transcript_11360/m.21854 type:complete len:156 (-) Transcript_11360:188-655(-)
MASQPGKEATAAKDAAASAAQPKVKGILKKSQPGPLKKNFKWDEKNLDQNEEEKVPRMKIDEPPTPYHNPDADGGEEEEEEEVDESNFGPTLVDTTEEKESVGSVQELGFKEARKRHYQMGGALGKPAKKKNMAEILRKANEAWGTKGKATGSKD